MSSPIYKKRHPLHHAENLSSSSSFILPQATRHHRLARAQHIFKKFSFTVQKLQKHIDGTGE
jgi:hypothetical protein